MKTVDTDYSHHRIVCTSNKPMWEFKIAFWVEIEFPTLILRMFFLNSTIYIGNFHFAITLLPNCIHNLFVLSELWLTACLLIGCII
jgi:hypothetical protein